MPHSDHQLILAFPIHETLTHAAFYRKEEPILNLLYFLSISIRVISCESTLTHFATDSSNKT